MTGYFFQCNAPLFPCPIGSQAMVSGDSLSDFAALGITSDSIGMSIAFGFGLVFLFAMLGMVVGWAIRLIRAI